MKEEKVTEQVEAAQEVKESVKDNTGKAIREEVEKIKLKYSAKVNMLIEDKDLREKLHELVPEAVDESFMMGQAAGVPEDLLKSVTDTFTNAASCFGGFSSSARAETYKKLFHNQRLITAHLMSAAQILQLQIGDTESMAVPDINSLFGAMGNTFTATPPTAL